LSDGTNGSVTEDVFLQAVSNLSLSQSAAAALTGIALVASGTTGGTITLTSNHTASEVWAYYRNWISTLANFNSSDTWQFDGTTLTIGGWTLIGLEYLTSGKLTASSATANAAFTASVTGNVIQATPTDLTGVTITGNLTYNTNTATTVTLSNCGITGAISNSGTALATVINSGSTIGSTGTNVTAVIYSTLTISGLVSGSDVVITTTATPDGTGTNVRQTFDSISGTSVSYQYAYVAATTVNIAVYKPGYKDAHVNNFTLPLASTTLPFSQTTDRIYT
jgi:hypothetical protein